MTQNRNLWKDVTCLLLGMIVAALLRPLEKIAQGIPTDGRAKSQVHRIAVLDVVAVFKTESQFLSDIERLRNEVEQFEARIKPIQMDFDQANRKLAGLEPGTKNRSHWIRSFGVG